MSEHATYMHRCLQLAASAEGLVAPNPMVGCVIVDEAGKILAEGFHHRFGGAHAEVMAFGHLYEQHDMEKLTLYVSLEPCSHYGKTPPCANLIIDKGIKRVIVAIQDPNPEVAGRGIELLRQNGIEVICGVLEEEARFLNRHFFTYHEKKRPYINLKWAQSINGSYGSSDYGHESRQISGIRSRQLSHKMRATHDAILVGRKTVESDNPSLNTREYPGKSPQIVLLDTNLLIPLSAKIFSSKETIHIGNLHREDQVGNIHYFKLDARDWPHQLMKYLYTQGLQSLLVEGGASIHRAFLEAGLWDECNIFQSSELRSWDIKAPDMPQGLMEVEPCGPDQHIRIFAA